MFTANRMEREKKTVKTMIHRYCADKHQSPKGRLCEECRGLLEYAYKRLNRCPFQEGKTTCGKCPVHCYRPGMREKIQEVMRYVGPRMILSNPVMALQHLLDGRRREPRKPRKSRKPPA